MFLDSTTAYNSPAINFTLMKVIMYNFWWKRRVVLHIPWSILHTFLHTTTALSFVCHIVNIAFSYCIVSFWIYASWLAVLAFIFPHILYSLCLLLFTNMPRQMWKPTCAINMILIQFHDHFGGFHLWCCCNVLLYTDRCF